MLLLLLFIDVMVRSSLGQRMFRKYITQKTQLEPVHIQGLI